MTFLGMRQTFKYNEAKEVIGVLTLQDIQNAVRETATSFGVSKATLFGSYARGEQEMGSDIDLVVELDRPLGFRRAELARSLQERLGTPVDLIFGKDQLYEPVRRSFDQDKVVLYEA